MNCGNLPVVNFKPVYCDLLTAKDFSKYEKYLLDISYAVLNGVCSSDLSRRDPGTTSHTRRLTTSNRILRLYIRTEEPSSELIQLVHYIMRVYSIAWFSSKMNHSCVSRSKHLWIVIKNSRFSSDDLKKVLDPVFSRNAFMAHSENLLLSMLADERRHIRELGVCRIIKARGSSSTVEHLRFVVHKLTFKANQYMDMIDWFKFDVTEPPIKAMRCAKIMTEAASTVCGSHDRAGISRNTMASRKIMPPFEHTLITR
ncbi:hypothetical protein AVEN_206576-1 [Araneus ventricosus]|uniref:Uncharacterized protein n=1 Tax=Araneus ventricosus TaxID=182803 RepID=A0A4Y2U623_ARAVE|nr:hypothetical protein AVEN_206576-1 [Araneus ventricosus]